MKKIFFLSFVFIIILLNSNKALAVQKEPTTEQRNCVKNALTTRETTVKNAFTEFLSSLNEAYTVRTTAINNAWNIPTSTQRVVTINQATKTYRTIKANAKTKYNKIKKEAWEKFKNEIRLKCSNNKYRFTSPDVNLEIDDSL